MVAKTVDLNAEQVSLVELLAWVRAGTEVIVQEDGASVARIIPFEKANALQPAQNVNKPRILGLHAHLGPAWMSDDFDEPLPDEFWLGEE